jgi:hypothetical protein
MNLAMFLPQRSKGPSNLMLRQVLRLITLGTAHGFGPLPSVATDMNTCWKPLLVKTQQP